MEDVFSFGCVYTTGCLDCCSGLTKFHDNLPFLVFYKHIPMYLMFTEWVSGFLLLHKNAVGGLELIHHP